MIATQSASATASDRRHAPRRQPAQGTTCQLAGDVGQQLGMGLVWNISTSGVSMLLGKPLEPGTQLAGELLAADGKTTLRLSLHVAHLRKLRTGDFFMGGQFQKPLTQQELGPFVGEVA